jgi:hypothetical protein
LDIMKIPMADYMLMVLEDEDARASQSSMAMAELIEKRARFVDGLRRAGQLKDAGLFRPSKEGRRVRREGDRLLVESGPFAEDGKTFGAYYWVQARSFDEAAELANLCPTLDADEIDVRPVIKGVAPGVKEAKPGKIFACAVLGNETTEAAWVQAMDRIDAETHSHPADSYLGGLRLEPPTSGRRVTTRGERRAMFDGPFLESKEVIGGAVFVRMTSMEEAVRWASETRFVVHGALEIRELWRI